MVAVFVQYRSVQVVEVERALRLEEHHFPYALPININRAVHARFHVFGIDLFLLARIVAVIISSLAFVNEHILSRRRIFRIEYKIFIGEFHSRNIVVVRADVLFARKRRTGRVIDGLHRDRPSRAELEDVRRTRSDERSVVQYHVVRVHEEVVFQRIVFVHIVFVEEHFERLVERRVVRTVARYIVEIADVVHIVLFADTLQSAYAIIESRVHFDVTDKPLDAEEVLERLV